MRLWILTNTTGAPPDIYGSHEQAATARTATGTGDILTVQVFEHADGPPEPDPAIDLLAPRYEDESGFTAARFAYLAHANARLTARLAELETGQ